MRLGADTALGGAFHSKWDSCPLCRSTTKLSRNKQLYPGCENGVEHCLKCAAPAAVAARRAALGDDAALQAPRIWLHDNEKARDLLGYYRAFVELRETALTR